MTHDDDSQRGGHRGARRAHTTELCLQLTGYLFEEIRRGRAIDAAARAFTRHRRRLFSGVVGGAGVAGGAWVALTAWSQSLGVWGALGLSLGLVSAPAWVPLAGGLAGLGAAGAGLAGTRSLRGRSRRRHLQSIIGLSREMVDGNGEEERLLRGFLRFRGVSEARAEDLLATTPRQARRAARHLSTADRWDVARCIYPIVYQGDGVASDVGRRRFARVCQALGLPASAPQTIPRDYRDRLHDQWRSLARTVDRLNWFAEELVFDLRELESVRDLLQRLSRFDPRRQAARLRQELLGRLGREPRVAAIDTPGEEAAVVTAYALAQTVLPDAAGQSRLGDAFERLVAGRPELSGHAARRLRDSRRRVDRLYRHHSLPA